jgi:hypothetical protein
MDGTNKEEIDVFIKNMDNLANLKVRRDNRDGIEKITGMQAGQDNRARENNNADEDGYITV